MAGDRRTPGLNLVEVKNPRVLDALARVDVMSDDEIRHLVRNEPPIVVEAGEALIADQHEEQPRP